MGFGKSEYGEVIEHPLVSRAISKAQKKVEAFHFDSRKMCSNMML